MNFIKKFVLIVFTISVFVSSYYLYNGYKMYKDAIEKVALEDKVCNIKNKNDYTKIEDMPKIYLTAVISVEDHRFYKHCGIDIISIFRAFFNDVRHLKFVEGGSTITQQLAKNIYFTQDKKIERKVAEVFMAFKIEKSYSKDEILELYLNTSYFGNGFYSVKSASLGYFNKIPKDMSSSEAIMLAGIPNAPSVYNPITNKDLAIKRQKKVIEKMIKYGNLDNKTAEDILK